MNQVGNAPHRYEPPQVTFLGSLEERTLGGGTFTFDQCSPTVAPSPVDDPCTSPPGFPPKP